MDTYRQEILETQKLRSNLLQRKLILNAVLGGIGLGLIGVRVYPVAADQVGTSDLLSRHVYLILCLIPLVCVYLDLLCHDLNLRIFVIAKFLKNPRRVINKKSNNQDNINLQLKDYWFYEKLCEEETEAFALESFALRTSSIAFSLLLIILPFLIELDTQNPLLDDYCLTVSGLVGIILTMWVDLHANEKKRLLYFREQSLDLDTKEKDYFKVLTDIKKYSKKSIFWQNTFVFVVSIVFLKCAWFIKFIANNNNNYPYLTFTEIISQFSTAKNISLIAIVIIVGIWIFLSSYSYNICNKFETLSQFTYNSSFENKCYEFLTKKITNTKISNLQQRSRKYANWLAFFSFVLLGLCLVVWAFFNGNCDENINKIVQTTHPNDLKTIGNRVGIATTIFLSLFTLAPGIHNYFGDYIDKIYKFKSFLPEEFGQIQEQFIAKLPEDENEQIIFLNSSYNSDDSQKKYITDSQNKEDNNRTYYLLLIKCSQGIVLVNPENYFVSSNNVIVKVGNSLNQDNLRCGNYWEIGFDFSIKIVKSDSCNDDTHYEFQDWKKLGDVDDHKSVGIEIGEKTALFFIYAD